MILPVDAGDFTFYDCAYEEILQGLGAINDDRSIPWTMFNDEVQMGVFDVYDQYLLKVFYDPRIRPGMTRDEVAKLLPEVLPAARGFVASTNSSDHAQEHGSLGATDTRTRASEILVNVLPQHNPCRYRRHHCPDRRKEAPGLASDACTKPFGLRTSIP